MTRKHAFQFNSRELHLLRFKMDDRMAGDEAFERAVYITEQVAWSIHDEFCETPADQISQLNAHVQKLLGIIKQHDDDPQVRYWLAQMLVCMATKIGLIAHA